MKKQILKYKLEICDSQTIHIPKNSEILTVQVQYNVPCLWALVDIHDKHNLDELEKELRVIEIIGTGNTINADVNRKYISTFQMIDGELVFNVFENLK